MIKHFLLVLIACLLSSNTASGAGHYPAQIDGAEVFTYKTLDQLQLKLYVIKPVDYRDSDRRPVIVFFFGGAWLSGTPEQFAKHCHYFASRGMVAITADYRVYSRHKSTVFQSVADAKSAIRWIRKNADRLGIDPNRIVASGGSAGGHLAASTGVVPGQEEPGEDTSESSQPNAMVLFNPVLAMAPIGSLQPFGEHTKGINRRIGGDPLQVSPFHHVQKNQPPAIIFFGSKDRLLTGAQHFTKASQQAGNRCELLTWEGHAHGFFNYRRFKNKPYVETLHAADKFLASLGYLKGDPTIQTTD